jgi:hypothetical protein
VPAAPGEQGQHLVGDGVGGRLGGQQAQPGTGGGDRLGVAELVGALRQQLRYTGGERTEGASRAATARGING